VSVSTALHELQASPTSRAFGRQATMIYSGRAADIVMRSSWHWNNRGLVRGFASHPLPQSAALAKDQESTTAGSAVG